MKLLMNALLGVIIVVLLLSSWAYADIMYFLSEELKSLLAKTSLKSSSTYEIPLFDCCNKLTGKVIGCKEGGTTDYEFVFHNNRLIGIGLGGYLREVLMESKELAQKTLSNHFGDKAKFLDAHLIYISPVSFWIRITYKYGDKVFNDLYPKSDSLRFTLGECEEENADKKDTLFARDGAVGSNQNFSWVEVQYDFPLWEYYLSSFSNAVVALADYWKFQDIIKAPIYPDDPSFFIN